MSQGTDAGAAPLGMFGEECLERAERHQTVGDRVADRIIDAVGVDDAEIEQRPQDVGAGDPGGALRVEPADVGGPVDDD